MTLLLALVGAAVALVFIGQKTRARVARGGGETETAIRKIREERKKRHGG